MQYYDSLHEIPLDELSEKVGGRHRLTHLVSQRLKMVNRGSPLLVELRENEAPLAAVCREVAEGKIWLEAQEEKQVTEQVAADFDILGLDDAF